MYSTLISFNEARIANALFTLKEEVLPRPYLKVAPKKEGVKIKFDLGFQESILIYCKREKEANFSLLIKTSESPFVDTRSNLSEFSEEREYKAIFCLNNQPVGEEDTIKVRTKGRLRFFLGFAE